MKKEIFFRIECSPKLGIGHFMRCINIANELIQNNNITFVCSNKFINNYRKFGDKRIKYLSIKKIINVDNFQINNKQKQKKDALEFVKFLNNKKELNIVFVDSYSLDYQWEKVVKKNISKLIVIDDLANRHHYCDFLIDQTINRKKISYKKYLNRSCKLLLGSKYCIIGQQFKNLNANSRQSSNIFERLNVSFGNFDNKNLILKTLIELEKSKYNFKRIDIFVSNNSKNFGKIKLFQSRSKINFNIFSDSKNFANMLSKSSLSIGAGGTTSWERCLLLIPSIVINSASNQNTIIKELKKEKLIYYAGSFKSKKLNLIQGIEYFSNNKNIKLFINKAKHKFDINGIKRIIHRINA